MTSIPIPKELDSPSGDKYRVLGPLIHGSSVYLAQNITHGDDSEDGKGTKMVATKFELENVEHHRLYDEAHAYNSLAGGPGIPFVHCSGTTEHYRYIVLDLLGPSLEDMFNFCDRKFTLKTILLIADQALSRIEYIHSQSCAHRDIKSEHLLMGSSKFGILLHLIRFGSAEFPDTNFDAETLFRDDLTSLGYVLLHFAWPELSWEDLKSKPTEYLCQRLPKEFATYFNCIRSLRSDETPCYSYLRKIFDDLFHRMGFKKDYVFDWTIRKYQKLAKKAPAVAQPKSPISEEESSDVEDEFSDSGDESSALGDEYPDSGDKSSVQGEGTPSTDITLQNIYNIAPQLESRPVSQDQLVTEVASIYAGLFIVENKCIEVDGKWAKPSQADSGHYSKLSGSQCLALIDLHRTQLFEIIDILMASQHPAASPFLHEFASRRKLPTRMWRHGIQPLLDLLRDRFPESRANFLTFLRLSYSTVALLYETAPELKAIWIECLYALAGVFKDADTEGGAIWEKRIQYWKSLREPAILGILQVDLSDVMLPDAFPISITKPYRIASDKNLLQEKDVVSCHLSEKSLELSLRQFTQKSPDKWGYPPVATCRDIFFAAVASFISSTYILRHEAQNITWWGSRLQAQSFNPIDFDSISDFSPVVFLCSCLVLGCALVSFHRRARLDKYQTYILILASIAGSVIGYGSGISVKLIIFGVIPWAVWLGMILTTIGHWVSRRYWWRTRCVRTELGEDIV